MRTIKITGKVNSAICYAKVVEEEALDQIKRMCDSTMSEGSKIRVMPDVHSGKGCTIGTTMTITDKVVPNVVGVDIGCGMLTVNLGKIDIDFKKLDEVTHYSGSHPPRKGMDAFFSFQNDSKCRVPCISRFARVLPLLRSKGLLTLLFTSFRRSHTLWCSPDFVKAHGCIRFLSKRFKI